MSGRAKKSWEDMLKEACPEPAPPTEQDKKAYGRTFRNFLVMLYPDCAEHMNMLNYLEQHSYLFQIVYILHDRDVWDEEGIEELRKKKAVGEYDDYIPNVGDLKKPHYHVLIHKKNPQSLKSFKEFFHIWIQKVLVCSSMESSILYFLHETPDSMSKPHYSVDELKGDKRMIKSVVQNSHFVQLGELLDLFEKYDGRMLSVLRNIQETDDITYLDTLKQYQSLLNTVSNQEQRRYYEKMHAVRDFLQRPYNYNSL